MDDLAARLAQGDEAAFTELYDTHADRLLNYLTLRFGSRDTALDVLQTVFLRAVKSRHRFRGVDNPRAYLFQIARNEATRMILKSERTTGPLPSNLNVAEGNRDHEQREEAELVALALARLVPTDREIVELKIYGGLMFREIAEIVKRPAPTVATQYRRALESLRDWLVKQVR